MSLSYADDKLVRGSEIRELYEEAGWTQMGARDPDSIELSVRHAQVFVTARDGSRLVGFAAAISDRVYYAHVTEFLVRAPWRGRGVGSELLRRTLLAVEPARVVSTFAEPDADGFYRRFGFAPMAGGLHLRRS